MQRVFNIIFAAHVLAYIGFAMTIAVIVAGRNIYASDLVFVFLAVGVCISLFSPKPSQVWGQQHSIKVMALFSGWGLIELARGIPTFGMSAIGESRLLVLPALFFFFFLAFYRDRNDLKRFLTIAVASVCVMPVVRAIGFYFLGGRDAFVDQFTGSILSTQAAFRFIQAGESALVSAAAVGLLVFVTGESNRRRRYALWLLSTALLVVIAIVQVRSAWITSVVGLLLGSVLVARFYRYAAISLATAVAVLALAGSVAPALRTDAVAKSDRPAPLSPDGPADPPKGGALQSSISYSATFLKDPAADVTAVWRLGLWRQALASAREHPVAGEGLGGYWKNVGPNGAPVNQLPHNGYLAVLVKLGGIGLILFLMALFLWALEILHFIRHEPDAYSRLLAKATAVTVTILATFAFFYDFTMAFWVMLGVGSVLVRARSSAGSA